ncbi:RNA polymerase sigma-70 factor [Mucilaginibacter conchicola]|uniref:RNA polymerase sigma-70 factor n=1 Tax=Mucilaginibacter conchicola TaxID=2303333 RepID=A0A372NQX6_9SPHI|nr:RNA polymerase sigma-70 factor [Mucilaginibacter conchicola]
MLQLPDIELANLLKADSEAVFKIIYERYWQKLYVVARKRLNNSMEAEEIVQDVFSNLWRRRHTFQLQKGFDNYFAVAVKFEVLNRMAKHARQSQFEKDAAVNLKDFDETTLQLLDYNELQRRFAITLSELPEKCRLVFQLQHYDGKTQKQIADEMDISVKTVEAHLSKARKKLRDEFGNLLGLLL